MFNINFKNIFNKIGSSRDEVIEDNQTLNTDYLTLELSNTYVSYRVNDNKKIETVNLNIQEFESFEVLLRLWVEAINVIVESLKIKPVLTILLKSGSFTVKHSEKFLDEKIKYKYFSNKLAVNEENIEVKYLDNKSYLIVEFKFLQKILFAFKDYKIKNIYDISILTSEHIKQNQEHFYMDISFNNCDIILNQAKIQKRALSTNLTNLVQECAKSSYVDYETSYQNIKLDFKDISTYEELENSTKPLQKNLKVFIDKLLKDIENTLSYFSINDETQSIENLYINGDVLEFDFIIKILNDKLNINMIVLNKYVRINSISKTNLTLFEKIDSIIFTKLNINFEGLNYNDGREEYVFIENRFIQKGQLSSAQKVKINVDKKEIKFDNKKSLFYGKNDIPFWKMDMSELFEYIKYTLFDKNTFSKENLTSTNVNKNVFYFIGIIPVALTILYLINTIGDLQRTFDNNVNTLEDRIVRVDRLKKTMINKNKEISVLSINKDIDKIFWTQKFITIANSMPNEIWLSSVTMENQIQNIENKEVTKQAMVLEARSLPSAIGHISSIALYMDKLLNANDDFQKDFSSINFGGARIVNEYGYDVVNFKLLCNFEKNIHIEEIKDKIKSKKDKSIGENLMNINQKSNEQQKILDKL